MYVTICERFYLNEGGAAGCVNRMMAKSNAKWGVQIAEMIFQARSSPYSNMIWIPCTPEPALFFKSFFFEYHQGIGLFLLITQGNGIPVFFF